MFRRMKRLRAECRWLYLFHIMLIAAGLCFIAWKLLRGQWGHAGLCLLTLAISDLTNLAEPALKLRVDAPLDVAVALFAVKLVLQRLYLLSDIILTLVVLNLSSYLVVDLLFKCEHLDLS